MNETDHIIELCLRLGAERSQAEQMAAQLGKRADQLASERSISRVEAMGYLLELLVKGRNGETVAGFEGVSRAT